MTSDQEASRRYGEGAKNLLTADHDQLIHHIDDNANVVWHHAHDFSDFWLWFAVGKVKETVLFCEFMDPRVGVFEDVAVTIQTPAVVCEGF